MPPHNDDEYYYRNRGHYHDTSPPFYYAGGAAPAYSFGALPITPQRLAYEGPTPFYQLPNSSTSNFNQTSRPRSMPPYDRDTLVSRGGRPRRSDLPSPSHGADYSRNPLDQARHVFKDSFSNSTSGLGVGILGAVVGGLAAREVSEANGRSRSRHGHREEHNNSRLLSTLVGAAVGGFGANALSKRLEAAKEKNADQQERWEQKFGKEQGRDRRRYVEDDDRGRRPGDRDRYVPYESRGRQSGRWEDNDQVYEARSRSRH